MAKYPLAAIALAAVAGVAVAIPATSAYKDWEAAKLNENKAEFDQVVFAGRTLYAATSEALRQHKSFYEMDQTVRIVLEHNNYEAQGKLAYCAGKTSHACTANQFNFGFDPQSPEGIAAKEVVDALVTSFKAQSAYCKDQSCLQETAKIVAVDVPELRNTAMQRHGVNAQAFTF